MAKLKLINDFPFFQVLKDFYDTDKKSIRREYKRITKKFLDFNDPNLNPSAFLRLPQFEALEMYVFIKEFFNNEQIYMIFSQWKNKTGIFEKSNSFKYTHTGQVSFYETSALDYFDVYDLMKAQSENYSNYIFALTMGIGKTILIGTCIFYEFLLAEKYPKDNRFLHNALIFAPDRTVLESLREVVTMDKSLVVPSEYISRLDANLKFHYLDDTGKTLNTIDNSNFNIIISNTQKIILKKIHKQQTAKEKLFTSILQDSLFDEEFYDDLYGDLGSLIDENEITTNQRFEKIKRLEQLGVYVDEAHHLFGNELKKSIVDKTRITSLRHTINILNENLERSGSKLVGCYNFTGTPYIANSILPEVVYYYGLSDAIRSNYLKEVEIKGYENVKSEDFLKEIIKEFFQFHKNMTYEGLLPKLAIFSASVDEVINEVKPIIEAALVELGYPISKVLVNVGDQKYTKDIDIKHFNDLDVVGTTGSNKQILLLVNKGKEGWNCRSLFSVALFREPKSKVFVLQSTMRAMRKITNLQQQATIFLSKSNLNILNDELQKNFSISVEDLNNNKPKKKVQYIIKSTNRVPILQISDIHYEYTKYTKDYLNSQIDFGIDAEMIESYNQKVYVKYGLSTKTSIKREDINIKKDYLFTSYSLTAEISRYFNIKPTIINSILCKSIDGIEKILEIINISEDSLGEIIIPKFSNFIYEIKYDVIYENKEVPLLDSSKRDEFVFNSIPELAISENSKQIYKYRDKSFHTDTYCFDSKAEMELFLQYIQSERVRQIYFTGMFTSDVNNIAIPYIDPDTKHLRKYYPDFVSFMEDGTIEVIEVKGDNKIDDETVQVKKLAAEEWAKGSDLVYKMIPSSIIMNKKII